jgi:hypothetical protein
MEGCFHAAREFFDECEKYPECGCVPHGIQAVTDEVKQSNNLGQKDDNAVIDPKSTGRKRAAKMFPLNRSEPCEWQRKRFKLADDSFFVGCSTGLQQNIHHGPNKDTLVNEPGNVWRICSTCHNRWHALIDPSYDWNAPTYFQIVLEHGVSDEEIGHNELFWINRKVVAGERAINPND